MSHPATYSGTIMHQLRCVLGDEYALAMVTGRIPLHILDPMAPPWAKQG